MICCCCCFGGCCCASTKAFSIFYLINFIFLMIFLISTMCIISWDKLPTINISLFIIICSFIFICFIFTIIICYCSSCSIGKNNIINTLAIIGIILTVFTLIVCILEEIILSLGFSNAKTNYPCSANYTVEVNAKVYFGFFIFKDRNNYENITKNI